MKAGLEIHQQLDTGKLFSGKASTIEEGPPVAVSYRKLHLTASELGESDAAAAAEVSKRRTFEYQSYPVSCGLVELDEEPPADANPRALETAFQFAELCSAQLVDEIVPMRKIVVDGSNTSGFQRTMLYAFGGTLIDPKTELEIPIPTMMLEEDSAKKSEALLEQDSIVPYNLSRLGIPLLEITTEPVFSDPEQLKSGALLIGQTLRLLDGVKRGLGTIRQDVNISVDGGARCEIKGAQDVRTMDELARREVQRQESLVAFAKRIKTDALALKGKPAVVDVTAAFEGSSAKVVASALKTGGAVLACAVPGWAGLTGLELSPANRVGTELSGYVKAHTTLKGLFHSDELPKYGITEADVKAVRKLVGAKKGDAFLLIAADAAEAKRGLELAWTRAKAIGKGVPSEVRRANPDNSTTYLREMPGAARMYPETDLLSIRSADVAYAPARSRAELEAHYKSLGLSTEFTRIVIDSHERARFDAYAARYPDRAPLLFKALYLYPKEAKTRHDADVPFDARFDTLLEAMIEGRLLEDSFVAALAALDKDDVDAILERFEPADESDLKDTIAKIVARERKKNPDASTGALMGAVMRELGGRISGKDAARIIGEL